MDIGQLPNVLGFLLGFVQMMLYCIYKNAKKDSTDDELDLKKHKPAGVADDKFLSSPDIAKFSGLDGKEMEVEVVVCNKPVDV